MFTSARKIVLLNKQAYSDRVLSVDYSHLISYWLLDDKSGTKAYSLKNYAGNVLRNSGLEIYSAPNFAYWNRTEADGGTVVQETVDVHGGASAAKVTVGTNQYTTFISADCTGAANVLLTQGITYTLKFWTHGNGTTAGKYDVYDYTHYADIIPRVTTGVSGLVYVQITVTFTVPTGCTWVGLRFFGGATAAVAYFDDFEIIAPASEYPTALNIVGVPTMGEPGIGDGRTSIYFDGVDDGINALTASHYGTILNTLQAALLSSDAGTMMIWAKPWNASMWTEVDAGDSTTHSLFWLSDGTANNTACSSKFGSEDNIISSCYSANGTGLQAYMGAGIGYGANWFHCCSTWSKTNDHYRNYFNGKPNTHVDWEKTGLGTWNALRVFYLSIGNKNTVEHWKGWLAHCAIWDKELSQPQVRNLALR